MTPPDAPQGFARAARRAPEGAPAGGPEPAGRLREQPVIIGIVGDSGTGKSTMAEGVAEILGRERAVVICVDDYHKYSRAERAKSGITPHDPDCNYLDILEQHVALLRAGHPVLKPVYNHNGGVLEPPEYVEPRDFIILEGVNGYATPTLREVYDVKVYLEPQDRLRLKWKFQRDTTLGGYTFEQVMASLDRLNADSARYIHPQRAYADMVVKFYPPMDDPDQIGGKLNAAHILRPTLPHLDLTRVLEAGGGEGLELELARDVDGRPVDALHVFGHVDPRRAEEMQRVLWQLIPGGPPEHWSRQDESNVHHIGAGESGGRAAAGIRIGAFRDRETKVRYSHTLALSQLLITHYLLVAALGHHVS